MYFENIHEQRNYWNKRAKTFRRYSGEQDDYSLTIFNNIKAHGIEFAGAKVLDLGCGCGWFSIDMAKAGADVTATDISREMLNLLETDAHSNGIFNIKCIESDWHDFNEGDRYDLIFCSLTPAIHDDATRQKLRYYARKWVVYLGFGGKHSDDFASIYKILGIKKRRGTEIGASEMHKWLNTNGIKYTSYSFFKKRSIEKSREEILENFAECLKPDSNKAEVIEKYIEQFKNEKGNYVHNSESEINMIIWDNSSYWRENNCL